MDEQSRVERSQHRREHFEVILEPIEAPYGPEPGEMRLRLTYNGAQWPVVGGLTPEERDKVWGVLDAERRARLQGAGDLPGERVDTARMQAAMRVAVSVGLFPAQVIPEEYLTNWEQLAQVLRAYDASIGEV